MGFNYLKHYVNIFLIIVVRLNNLRVKINKYLDEKMSNVLIAYSSKLQKMPVIMIVQDEFHNPACA